MRKRLTAVLLTCSSAAALAFTLGTAPAGASAAATWTVAPGGAFTAAGSAELKDTNTGSVLKCTSLKLEGTLKKGIGLPGVGLGKITTVAWGGCTGPAATTFDLVSDGLPWRFNAHTYTEGVTEGTIK